MQLSIIAGIRSDQTQSLKKRECDEGKKMESFVFLARCRQQKIKMWWDNVRDLINKRDLILDLVFSPHTGFEWIHPNPNTHQDCVIVCFTHNNKDWIKRVQHVWLSDIHFITQSASELAVSLPCVAPGEGVDQPSVVSTKRGFPRNGEPTIKIQSLQTIAINHL